jgi:hypothetical protein
LSKKEGEDQRNGARKCFAASEAIEGWTIHKQRKEDTL